MGWGKRCRAHHNSAGDLQRERSRYTEVLEKDAPVRDYNLSCFCGGVRKTLSGLRTLGENTWKAASERRALGGGKAGYNKNGQGNWRGGWGGGGTLKGGQWWQDALSATTMDLGGSYFAVGDRLSTQRSFTSPLETHFIDFSIFLLCLLSHPTTHFPRALASLGKAPGDCLPTPPPPQALETGVKDLEGLLAP